MIEIKKSNLNEIKRDIIHKIIDKAFFSDNSEVLSFNINGTYSFIHTIILPLETPIKINEKNKIDIERHLENFIHSILSDIKNNYLPYYINVFSYYEDEHREYKYIDNKCIQITFEINITKNINNIIKNINN